MEKKNYGKSVRARLVNLMNETGYKYMYLLARLLYKPNLKLFSDEFVTDKDRIIRWKAFLKKIKWKEEIPFPSVMQVVRERLQPLANRYWGMS